MPKAEKTKKGILKKKTTPSHHPARKKHIEIIRKKVEKPKAKLKSAPKPEPKPSRYFETVGRRKTAVARVRFFTKGKKEFLVNGKPLENYFPILELQHTAKASLERMNCLDRFGISAKVKGGGLSSQAEALRHGIARALVLFDADFRKRLKKAGFLTRDSRKRERKKFGLKRARRAPQWRKR